MSIPEQVTIVEVGPRDGLQNETQPLCIEDKVWLINALSQAGLKNIEAGSFVSPKWVPQMANSAEVMRAIKRDSNICYSALTPNLQGMQAALHANADEVAIFAAASETFSQKNINCSIAESLQRFADVSQLAQAKSVPMRGYISCIAVCPYEGKIKPQRVADVAQQLIDLGCRELSLGDTIGAATPKDITAVIEAVSRFIPIEKLAIHCHDTYGQALVNIYQAMTMGVSVVDSSVAGLGGCPYAKGASGNVATEDVVYMLNGLGIKTGVDLDKVILIGNQISSTLGRQNPSKVAQATSHH